MYIDDKRRVGNDVTGDQGNIEAEIRRLYCLSYRIFLYSSDDV